MTWICTRCGRPSKILLTAKISDIYNIDLGDLCLSCIKEMAEGYVAMDKADDIGIGYTQEALQEGALRLMKCQKCGRYREEILMGSSEFCPSCFLFYLYSTDK